MITPTIDIRLTTIYSSALTMPTPPWPTLVIKLRNVAGNLAMIPVKMIRDIPFPIPFSEIFSPNHIKKAVPAVNVVIIRSTDSAPVSFSAPRIPNVMAVPWMTARITAPYLVHCDNFRLPSTPDLAISSRLGITTCNS